MLKRTLFINVHGQRWCEEGMTLAEAIERAKKLSAAHGRATLRKIDDFGVPTRRKKRGQLPPASCFETAFLCQNGEVWEVRTRCSR